jgi:hypothetical protein
MVMTAKKRAANFTANRVPKFLGCFERILKRNAKGGDFIFGKKIAYERARHFRSPSRVGRGIDTKGMKSTKTLDRPQRPELGSRPTLSANSETAFGLRIQIQARPYEKTQNYFCTTRLFTTLCTPGTSHAILIACSRASNDFTVPLR